MRHSKGQERQGSAGELSSSSLRRRLLELAAVVALVAVVIVFGPGLGALRARLSHASLTWLALAVGVEVLSALCYVVIFRAVFCRRMRWRLAYQIGMAEQGANSVLSVSGAGGLALGAWALRQGGMSLEHIGRRTVAFFLLTSFANVITLIVFAVLMAAGAFEARTPALTYGFGGAALLLTILALWIPRLLGHAPEHWSTASGRIRKLVRFARESLSEGVSDGLMLLRRRPIGVLIGSFGTMGFDMAALELSFRAFGHAPAVDVLVLGYLIGQLGGNLPVPGGVGGLDAGLIGVFLLYHQPLAATSAAVLLYHAISLWVPALLGTDAFLRLRRTLWREADPMRICMPLAEPLDARELAEVR